ncbi:MAG TPA: S41 family peptidase [Mycobacteriales bacterium]|jgi:carboxyl-terminal processing protease|nr:S41 family peptidase [Mycobacteriales bacterium]
MLSRRRARVAVAAAIALAFVAGGFVGAVVRPTHQSRSGDSVLDQAQQAIEAHAANPVPIAVLQQAAVDGMLRALGDPWSAYYEPTQYASFQRTLSGSYSGVGVWVRRTSSGALRIESVEAGSPAAIAGLHAGDALSEVAGLPVTGLTVADVVSRLRGEPGTEVSIRVDHDGRLVTDVLARSTIANDDVAATRVAPGVVQLRIAAFTSGVGRWIYQQVAKAADQHLRGIILDLRDDPGGLLTEAVSTASAFLARGPVVSYVQRDSAPDVLDALGGGNTGIPLVVLVNGGTASAAEIVAGALQDRGRAIIVGSQTFGKGSVQAPDQLSDGSDIELTIGHYLTPDGRPLDGVGITPDVLVGPDVASSVLYQRAMEVLSGLTADAGSAG